MSWSSKDGAAHHRCAGRPRLGTIAEKRGPAFVQFIGNHHVLTGAARPELRVPGSAIGEQEHSLRWLHRWLTIGGVSGGVLAASFWLPYGLIVSALVIAAVLFTPFMLWHLAKARWVRAIMVYGVFVILPLTASRFVDAEATVTRFLLVTSSAHVLSLHLGTSLSGR